jgi:hypothetical protein
MEAYTAPRATPESPDAGCTNISSKIFDFEILPFNEQLSPTPPAIHNFETLYFFFANFNLLKTTSSSLNCSAAAIFL